MRRVRSSVWSLFFMLLLVGCGSGEMSSATEPDGSSPIPAIREGETCGNEGVSTTVPCFSVSVRCPSGGARQGYLFCQQRWLCVFDPEEGCEGMRQDAAVATDGGAQNDVLTDTTTMQADDAPPGEIGLIVELDKPEREIASVQGSVFRGHSLILSALAATNRRVAGINLYARGFTGSGYRASDAARVVQNCHLERENDPSETALTPDIMPDASGIFHFQPQGLTASGSGVHIRPVCHAAERVSLPDGYRIAFGIVGPSDIEATDENGQRVAASISSIVRNQAEGEPTAFVRVYPSGALEISHHFTADLTTGGGVWVYPNQYQFAVQRETVSTPRIPISWEGDASCIEQVGIIAQGRRVTVSGVNLIEGNTVTLSTSLSFTPGPPTPVQIGVRFYRPVAGSRCAPGQRVSFSIGTAVGGHAYGVEAVGTTSNAPIVPTGNPRTPGGDILHGATVTVN